MPRRPLGLHLPASSVPNRGGRARRPERPGQEQFIHMAQSPIGPGIVQGIVANDGSAILPIGPQGVGTRWYPSQIQVATSSGPADQSQATLYRQFIDPKQQIGQTQQGGGDTLAFTHSMQPGDLIYVVWARANPGDLATVTVHGDQTVLTASPV